MPPGNWYALHEKTGLSAGTVTDDDQFATDLSHLRCLSIEERGTELSACTRKEVQQRCREWQRVQLAKSWRDRAVNGEPKFDGFVDD